MKIPEQAKKYLPDSPKTIGGQASPSVEETRRSYTTRKPGVTQITGEVVQAILSNRKTISPGSLSQMTGLAQPEVELIIEAKDEGLR